MASRRSSSSRRSRGNASAVSAPRDARSSAARRAERSLKIDPDGRALVACPQCGNHYRVPEAQLEAKLVCRNCKRAFIPKAAGAGRRRHANPYTPFIVGGVTLTVVILLGVVIANVQGSGVKMAPLPEVKASVNLGLENSRVQDVVSFVKAVHDGDTLRLASKGDLASLQTLLGVAPDRPIDRAGGDERNEIERMIADALKTDERSQPFVQFEPADGHLADESMVSSHEGVVALELNPREGSPYYEKWKAMGWFKGMRAHVDLSFRMEGQTAVVTGWKVVSVPAVPTEGKRSHHVAHATIEKPKERVVDGEKIRESELSPLGHLEDTPPETRKEIDDLIAKMVDLELPGGVSNRCIDRLREIGRPAIPRLLNQMYERNQKSAWTDDDKLAMRRIIQALAQMTGMRFNYNVADRQELSVEGNQQQRLSALKQWYAWWYDNHDRAYDRAIQKDDDESLFLTDEERAAKDKQEAAANDKH